MWAPTYFWTRAHHSVLALLPPALCSAHAPADFFKLAHYFAHRHTPLIPATSMPELLSIAIICFPGFLAAMLQAGIVFGDICVSNVRKYH